MSQETPNLLDLTSNTASDQGTADSAYTLKEEAYDPQPLVDSARRRIAYILLSMLGFILLWSLSIITIWPNLTNDVISLLQIVLSPIIALVSAATGFYYGSKNG